jgi:ABC-type spermidine/putrescine transport system permease subunit II
MSTDYALAARSETGGGRSLVARVLEGRQTYLIGAICMAISALMLAPLVLTFAASLKSTMEAAALPPTYLPQVLSLDSYQRLWSYQDDLPVYLLNSGGTAALTILFCLALTIPAGYALARRNLPWRGLILLAFLLPQAFPSVAVYINVARIFYGIGLNGTIAGVVLVHTVHGLVFSVWITTAAFAAVDHELEQAARNIGASPLRAFMTVTLPLAAPGIMASAIFVFLESLDEFTGTYFVGVPDITTLPLLLFTASMEGNYQIASITALILLVPSVGFMLFIERFLRADVLAKVGS